MITKFKSWGVTLLQRFFISTTYTTVPIWTIILSTICWSFLDTVCQKVRPIYWNIVTITVVKTYTFLYLLIRMQNSLQTCISVELMHLPKSSSKFLHWDSLFLNDCIKSSLHALPSGFAIFFHHLYWVHLHENHLKWLESLLSTLKYPLHMMKLVPPFPVHWTQISCDSIGHHHL